jgi:hypothetical protein
MFSNLLPKKSVKQAKFSFTVYSVSPTIYISRASSFLSLPEIGVRPHYNIQVVDEEIKHSLSSVFTVIMFYNVVMNTDLVNTDHS